MKFIKNMGITTALLLLGSGGVQAQDSANFDAQSNTWKLYYQDRETSQWLSKTYVQQNAISPGIKSTVQAGREQFVYRYRVRNGRDAKQLVDTFRIWGIPLVYTVSNLPAVTASQNEGDKWTRQYWAQLEAKAAFERAVVSAPKGWTAGLRVDEKVGQTSFVWTPGLKDTDPDGIPAGQTQDGFAVTRPELPGMARAKLAGATEEPWGLDNLPDTAFWRQKVDEIQDRDYVLVPVLAPVIPVPMPYNGAELARRIRAHVQTWLKYGHIDADTLTRLNRQFDVLIPALERGNRHAARAAMYAMRKDCIDRHPGFRDEYVDADDDDHDSHAMPRTPAQRYATAPLLIDRVALRALAFDLRYLLEGLDRTGRR